MVTKKRAFRLAKANLRLEGLRPSKHACAVYRKIERGELSFEEGRMVLIARTQSRRASSGS